MRRFSNYNQSWASSAKAWRLPIIFRTATPKQLRNSSAHCGLDPSLWGSDLFLGMDYYKTNQFALALAPLQASIALNAKMAEPEARFWLGVTNSALNRPEDALRELRLRSCLAARNIDVLYYLARLMIKRLPLLLSGSEP